jgi:CO/xanthine dehydrogenase FAD-binding subunit
MTPDEAAAKAQELAILAGTSARPIDDFRSTAEYRQAVAENLVADALHGLPSSAVNKV